MILKKHCLIPFLMVHCLGGTTVLEEGPGVQILQPAAAFLCGVHVLPVSECVLSRFSISLLHCKDMHVRLIDYSKLAVSVNACWSLCVSPATD